MKYAVYILLALIIGFGIASGTYIAYCYHVEPFDSDELVCDDLTIDSDGNFSGKFRSNDKSRKISGFEYEIEDGKLYITVLVTAGNKRVMECDIDGYATFNIEGLEGVKKVYQRTPKKDYPLDTKIK